MVRGHATRGVSPSLESHAPCILLILPSLPLIGDISVFRSKTDSIGKEETYQKDHKRGTNASDPRGHRAYAHSNISKEKQM